MQNSNPPLATSPEKETLDRVRRQLGDDCIVIPNLRLSATTQNYEEDLLVLMPGSGTGVVEAKGSHIRHDGHDWRRGLRSATAHDLELGCRLLSARRGTWAVYRPRIEDTEGVRG